MAKISYIISVSRGDNIKKEISKIKEKIHVYFQKNNSHLFFIIGLLTGIFFILINISNNITYGIIFLILGIIVFEIFKYYYGETPDIIITDHEDVEKTYSYIKKTIQESIEESKSNKEFEEKEE